MAWAELIGRSTQLWANKIRNPASKEILLALIGWLYQFKPQLDDRLSAVIDHILAGQESEHYADIYLIDWRFCSSLSGDVWYDSLTGELLAKIPEHPTTITVCHLEGLRSETAAA